MISGTMPLLYTPDHLLHAPGGEFDQGKIVDYRDSPERVDGIYLHLIARGLCLPVRFTRAAGIDDLFRVHSLQMLDFLEATSNAIQDETRYQYAETFPIRAAMAARPKSLAGRLGYYSTDLNSPVGQGTWQALLSAAGLALQGAEMLMRHETSCAYVLCRPPGHHAGPDFFGSYSYTNHAALAASRLMALGQVAILDIDYHHGNGTQAIFWEEPRVLYTSLHIDPNLDLPYFSGYAHETGGSQAPGSTFNLPLPPGITSGSYLAALEALLRAVRAFRPAALVVSLGYDPYQGDPTSAFRVEAGAYSAIGSRIAALRLPTLIVQEGGYAVETLPALAENFVTVFLEGMLVK
ncbi:MAG: histone deacetylase family protein [Chloroflexi bacterium]|nr:MAG: histone deacetylase family protein [Chloroflexota bacterium]